MGYSIYKLTSPNGKVYIGQTNNFNQRMIEHKNCKKKNKLYNCIRKYGWDNFTKEILVQVESKEQANLVEESLIVKYKAVGHNGLNVILTAEGGDVWIGRYDTPEYMDFVERMKIINRGHGNGMFGKSHSDDTRLQMKEKAKGRFSLQWYIDRNGKDVGQQMYDARRAFLSNRSMTRDEKGNFIKKTRK